MRFERSFTVVDSHTEGECTRVIIGGVPPIPGRTMKEKYEYFSTNLSFMRALSREPRQIVSTGSGMTGVITDPVSQEADYGMFFVHGGACFHGTMGVVATLVECGMVPQVEPVTEVKLDTNWGFISAKANVRNSKVESITLRNVPCFLHSTLSIDIPEIGKKNVKVDIAYGGNFYIYVSADDLGVMPIPENFRKLEENARIVPEAVETEVKRQDIRIQHPDLPEKRLGRSLIQYTHNSSCFAHAEIKGDVHAKQQLFWGRKILGWDRSPCGTGTCGRLAQMYSQGLIKMDQELVNESMIGTYFIGKVVAETKVGKFSAIVPEVTGRVWITAISTQVFDPTDPFKYGIAPKTHPYY